MKGIQTGVAVAALLIGASAWSADTKLGSALDDSAVTANVKAALVGNPDTKAGQINVDASNGVVTLSGTVDSLTAKMSAESTARNVNGVSTVENRLMVSGSAASDTATARADRSLPGAVTPSDRATTPADRIVIASSAPSGNTSLDSSPRTSSANTTRSSGDTTASGSTVSGDVDSQVMQALKSDQRTANLPVEVKSGKSGSVTLTGTVSSAADRSAAAEVARGVPGVSKVDNKIMVKTGSGY